MRTAILLAAGSSRRYGAANKLLARRGGPPLVTIALRIAQAAPVARIVAVTGAQGPRVAAALRGAGGRTPAIIRAVRHRDGLAASLRAGLGALRPCERSVFIFLGDMPAVPPRLAQRLVRELVPGIAAVRPTWRGRPGHPVLLRVPPSRIVASLTGDRGLARLIAGARTIPAGPGVLLDIDRPRTGWRPLR